MTLNFSFEYFYWNNAFLISMALIRLIFHILELSFSIFQLVIFFNSIYYWPYSFGFFELQERCQCLPWWEILVNTFVYFHDWNGLKWFPAHFIMLHVNYSEKIQSDHGSIWILIITYNLHWTLSSCGVGSISSWWLFCVIYSGTSFQPY